MKNTVLKISIIVITAFVTFGCENAPDDGGNKTVIIDQGIVCDKGTERKITLLGDSRTAFLPQNDLVLTSHNYGVAGRTSQAVIDGILPDVMCDYVIISVGINDIIENVRYGKANTPCENIVKLINIVKNMNPESIIIVTSVIPVTTEYDEKWNEINKNVEELNAKIETACAANGVIYVPINMHNSDGSLIEEYTVDHIHYNRIGYNVFISVINDTIDIIEKASEI